MPRHRRGRPINWGNIPKNGLAVKGAQDIANDVRSLYEFALGNEVSASIVNAILDYGVALIDTDGMNVTIGKETDGETKGKIVAKGNDILFWEFGTGVILSGSHPKAAELGIEPASFSRDHDKWLVGEKLEKFQGRWPYGGRWIMGRPPSQSMWHAAKMMRENLFEIVRDVEVF